MQHKFRSLQRGASFKERDGVTELEIFQTVEDVVTHCPNCEVQTIYIYYTFMNAGRTHPTAKKIHSLNEVSRG